MKQILFIVIILFTVELCSQTQKVYSIKEFPIERLDTIIVSAILLDLTHDKNEIKQFHEGVLDWKPIYRHIEIGRKYKLIIFYRDRKETYFLFY